MAYLDNSGDIILDAVLTDAGRKRMARGNFKIVKFALGDEEINYKTFNGSHPSGSAFYDLQVMQTPILEAFTNNTSLMKSKLVTMDRNNILFLPVLKLNNLSVNNTEKFNTFDGYYLLADNRTAQLGGQAKIITTTPGILYGTSTNNEKTTHISVDQGLDTQEGGLSIRNRLPGDLLETAFIVKLDHRLLRLQPPTALAAGRFEPRFVDDDAVATYYFSQGDGTDTVYDDRDVIPGESRMRNEADIESTDITDVTNRESFSGPLGSVLQLIPKTSLEVQSSVSLFNEIGAVGTENVDLIVGDSSTSSSRIASGAHKYIDTLINVVGVTTGYAMDIPIRIIRKD